jgi:hypothetical protein
MKFFIKALGLIFAFSILSAEHYHEPSFTLFGDWEMGSTYPTVYTTLHHQSSLDVGDGNIILLHALTSPHSTNTFHNELGVGFRKLFENLGVGINFLYAHQNTFGFHNHQLSPGLELYYDHFRLAFNHYRHVKSSVEFKKNTYSFHDISEVTLSYRPSKKYEFSFTPLFNHSTRKFGYQGEVSAYLFDNWKCSVIPHCEPGVKKGVAFSVGFHFGGAKKKETDILKKSHRFFYYSDAKPEVEKRSSPAIIIAPPAPVFTRPAVEKEEKSFIDPPKKKGFIDSLFFWRK